MIQRLIVHLVANILGLYIIDRLLTDFCFVSDAAAATCPAEVTAGVTTFIVAGLVLGILNTFVKPLLKILALPVTFLTAGLFIFVINAVVIWLLVWLINTLAITGVHVLVLGTLTYLYAAIILGLFNLVTHFFIKD